MASPLRMTGMNSGMDTEAIVKSMVAGYESKKQKVANKQTKTEWKQEIWKDANSKVYSLYSGLDKVRFASAYKARKTTVSDPSKATVTAKNGAANGTQKLRVTQMAATGYLTGGKVKTSTGLPADSDTRLTSLGIEEGSTIDLTADGKRTSITVEKDMTIADFTSKLKAGGVNASYDAENNRFFISAKGSGADKDFQLTGRGSSGLNALKALGLYTKSADETSALQNIVDYGVYKSNGSLDGEMTAEKVKREFGALQTRYSDALAQKTSLTSQKANLTSQKDEADAAASSYSRVVDYLKDKKLVEERQKAGGDLSDDEYQSALARVTELESAVDNGAETDATVIAKVAEAREVVNAGNDTVGALTGLVDDNTQTLEGYRTTAESLQTQIADLDTQLADAQGVMDGVTNEIKANSLFADYASGVEAVSLDDVAASAISKINAAREEMKTDANEGATRIKGADAEIFLNGAKFTSATNSFSINGYDITANGLTGDEELTLSTTTDVDGIYDKFKEFLGQYNDIINDLQSKYNADSAKGYEPLTDEQKEEMNEKEIEKWETKIKDSLLRRDGTLGSIISAMSTAMTGSFKVTMGDGSQKEMSLAGIGVHTLGRMNAKTNEQYAYHIDGDEDDSTTSGKPDKLRAFIESDPDAAADLLSQAANSLYKALDTKIGMKSTENSSAFTMYNDKQMKKEIDSYKKSVKQWEDRIADQEDAYYKKFTAMEKALANLNSSQTALSGMVG